MCRCGSSWPKFISGSGKKKEAWEIFSAAADSVRARGSAAAAEDVLKRMSVPDPGNGYVLLLRGKGRPRG